MIWRSMTSYLPVLIVGAGPTGLTAAAELSRHGIAYRIIDKKPEPTVASNAAWIQSRTLELFELLDLTDEFIRLGQKCQAMNFYANGELSFKIPFDQTDSNYPFIIMLAQAETEAILIDHLKKHNHQVEFSIELVDVKQENGMVVSTIKHPNGRLEEIYSQWLIACDGANSTVRTKANIYFPGEDLQAQFIVADAEIDSLMSKHEIHFFFAENTVFLAFPLGSNRYRISANLNLDYPRKIFSEKEIIELAQERAHGNYYVKQVAWISPFWVHSKVITTMRDGSLFFAGDAAHTFSPASGQGMNTGIQDAFNLAWKLALVIKHHAKAEILDTYQAERYPLADNMVELNETFTKMALYNDDFLSKLNEYRKLIANDASHITTTIANKVTQLDIQYKDSALVDSHSDLDVHAKAPGTRAPNVNLPNHRTLLDSLKNGKHLILIFSGENPSTDDLSNMESINNSLNHHLAQFAESKIISSITLASNSDVIFDENQTIHRLYHLNHPAIYIIRPDSYIAHASKSISTDPIEAFFKRYH